MDTCSLKGSRGWNICKTVYYYVSEKGQGALLIEGLIRLIIHGFVLHYFRSCAGKTLIHRISTVENEIFKIFISNRRRLGIN